MSIETYPNFQLIKHALLEDKMTVLRHRETKRVQFRSLLAGISTILMTEATRELPLQKRKSYAPCGIADGYALKGVYPVIMPILRAGLGMLEPALGLFPDARVGHIGIKRDEITHEPHLYYYRIPRRHINDYYFLVDPMLATGGSAVMAVNHLKSEGIKNIRFVCIVASPEGRDNFCNHHPDVQVYCASLDDHLNASKYIVPGLGDAGDRIFGTD